jgi:hypothetical protein
VIALLLTLSLGQIDVRSDGGYVGRARSIIDCRDGLVCSADSGVAYLSGASTVRAGSCSAGQYVTAVSTSAAPSCADAPASRSYLYATLSTPQLTVDLTSNAAEHVKFDTVIYSKGSAISLDTATAYSTTNNAASVGRFTLSHGRAYRMSFSYGWAVCDQAWVSWYNADDAGFIGMASEMQNTTNANNNNGAGVLTALYQPDAGAARVEVRFGQTTNCTSLGVSASGGGQTWVLYPTALIEEIEQP